MESLRLEAPELPDVPAVRRLLEAIDRALDGHGDGPRAAVAEALRAWPREEPSARAR